MKYVLICVCDSEITYTRYSDKNAALRVMEKQFISDFRDWCSGSDSEREEKVSYMIEGIRNNTYVYTEQSIREGDYFDADIDVSNGMATISSLDSYYAWVVHPCETNLVLVSKRGRELEFKDFSRFEDAHNQMRKEFLESLADSADSPCLDDLADVTARIESVLPLEGAEYSFDSAAASINESSSLMDSAWRIIPLLGIASEKPICPDDFVFFATGQRYNLKLSVRPVEQQISHLLKSNRYEKFRPYTFAEVNEILNTNADTTVFLPVDIAPCVFNGANICWYDATGIFSKDI